MGLRYQLMAVLDQEVATVRGIALQDHLVNSLAQATGALVAVPGRDHGWLCQLGVVDVAAEVTAVREMCFLGPIPLFTVTIERSRGCSWRKMDNLVLPSACVSGTLNLDMYWLPSLPISISPGATGIIVRRLPAMASFGVSAGAFASPRSSGCS